MYNIYLYRSDIIDARIPITIFYAALCEIKLINHPAIFCDKYPKNLSRVNIPIFNTSHIYNIAYTPNIFFVDSLKDIEVVKYICPDCKFILFNDQKIDVPNDYTAVYNFIVKEDTKLEDVLNFLQENGI